MYRIYHATKYKSERQAIGYWQGIKDNIYFEPCYSLKYARLRAKDILKVTSENCIAVEDVGNKVLYIIYSNRTEVLSGYIAVKTSNKVLYHSFRLKYKNYTVTRDKAFRYYHKLDNDTPQKNDRPLTFHVYTNGEEIY